LASKTRVIELSCGVVCFYDPVFSRFSSTTTLTDRQTDRQTDKQTDAQLRHIPRPHGVAQ